MHNSNLGNTILESQAVFPSRYRVPPPHAVKDGLPRQSCLLSPSLAFYIIDSVKRKFYRSTFGCPARVAWVTHPHQIEDTICFMMSFQYFSERFSRALIPLLDEAESPMHITTQMHDGSLSTACTKVIVGIAGPRVCGSLLESKAAEIQSELFCPKMGRTKGGCVGASSRQFCPE